MMRGSMHSSARINPGLDAFHVANSDWQMMDSIELLGYSVYLNSCTDNDAHEEVGDHAGNGHHQALDDGDTGVEAQDEEEVVHEARVEAHHEVAHCSRHEGDQKQEWHRRKRVANNKC
jgi:hypothetical protein